MAATGAGLLLMTLPAVRDAVLSFVRPLTAWDRYGRGLALVFAVYGLAFLASACWSARETLRGAPLPGRLAAAFRRTAAGLRTGWRASSGLGGMKPGDSAGLAAALAIGLGLRTYFLSLPLRYDECRTFLQFVNRSARDLFSYTEPNNHVMHTLLVKLSTRVWGSSPLPIRIPALLASVASIALIYRVARDMDRESGTLSALAAAVFPYLVLFGSIARGYSLSVALMSALILVGSGYLRNAGRGRVCLFAALSALALWTMPSMAFAFSGLLVWIAAVLMIRRQRLAEIFRGFLFPCLLWTSAFTFVLYTPVIIASNGVGPIVANRFVTPQPFGEFLRRLPGHLRQTWGDYTRDVPAGAIAAISLLALWGLYRSFRKRQWAAALLLPASIFGSAAVLFLSHRIPFPRTWIFLVPAVLVTADYGLSGLTKKWAPPGKALLRTGLVAAAAFTAFHLMAIGAIGRYPDVGTFPEAPAIATFLKSRVNPWDRIRARVPADEVMKFYLWTEGIAHDRRAKDKGAGRNHYYIVKPSRYGIEKLTDRPVEKIFALGDAEVYRAKR